jgi:hypothetical protein
MTLTNREKNRIVVREGLVFLSTWPICDCGSETCTVVEKIIVSERAHKCIMRDCCKALLAEFIAP